MTGYINTHTLLSNWAIDVIISQQSCDNNGVNSLLEGDDIGRRRGNISNVDRY